jgi:hypothetical protein
VTRTWRMFAGRAKTHQERFLHCGDERTVRFCGMEPVAVELTEDPDGEYYGWIRAAREGLLPRTYTGIPEMIQWHRGIFEMQSPDGFRSDVNAGEGEIVRMTCRAIEEGEPS